YEKYSLTIIVPRNVPRNTEIEKTIERLHPKINLLYTTNAPNLTVSDEYKYNLFLNRGLNGIVNSYSPNDIMLKEYRRLTGNVIFDKVIDFSGYNARYNSVLAYSDVKEKIVFQH